MKSFVEFRLTTSPPGYRKTVRWQVLTAYGEHQTLLGHVYWYGPWRCYAFYPGTDTLYEKACLRSIANFCEAATDAQRKKTAEARQQPVPPPGN